MRKENKKQLSFYIPMISINDLALQIYKASLTLDICMADDSEEL